MRQFTHIDLRVAGLIASLVSFPALASAESVPPLSDLVPRCALIAHVRTEKIGERTLFKVVETWKGDASPRVFVKPPPPGYIDTHMGSGPDSRPDPGHDVILFFTRHNQPPQGISRHDLTVIAREGKIIWPPVTREFGDSQSLSLAQFRQRVLLSLPVREFDQTPGGGWRLLADRKKWTDAAKLIEAYLDEVSGLGKYDRANLHFHAAQCHALDGNPPGTEAALKHLAKSRHQPEIPNSGIRWNDYVDATEAFLRRDKEALHAARTRIAAGRSSEGSAPNLEVVDRLIASFEKTYSEAYQSR